jgi:hypothetical protein
MSVRRFLYSVRGYPWSNGHELIPFITKQAFSSSYPQHAIVTEAKTRNLACLAGAGLVLG